MHGAVCWYRDSKPEQALHRCTSCHPVANQSEDGTVTRGECTRRPGSMTCRGGRCSSACPSAACATQGRYWLPTHLRARLHSRHPRRSTQRRGRVSAGGVSRTLHGMAAGGDLAQALTRGRSGKGAGRPQAATAACPCCRAGARGSGGGRAAALAGFTRTLAIAGRLPLLALLLRQQLVSGGPHALQDLHPGSRCRVIRPPCASPAKRAHRVLRPTPCGALPSPPLQDCRRT